MRNWNESQGKERRVGCKENEKEAATFQMKISHDGGE